MLREPASSSDYLPPSPSSIDSDTTSTPLDDMAEADADLAQLQALLTPYFDIITITTPDDHTTSDLRALSIEDQTIIERENGDLSYIFIGHLKQEASRVYTALEKALVEQHRFPLLRMNPEGDQSAPHRILIIEGIKSKPDAPSYWKNIILFLLTVFSVLYTGAQIAIAEISLTDPAMAEAIGFSIPAVTQNIWRGIPYAVSIMAILIPHEMAHYIMMRRHGVVATLPYFIPAWLISPFGTFGAAIALHEPLRNRRALLDVGAAGPIAGFIVAVPLVIYGLYTSSVIPLDMSENVIMEGNSLIYAFAKIVALGQMYPTAEADVLLNQIAFAGWTGLFVTALNMIPLGQLDGGHVMYALFGERARLLFYPAIAILIGISIVTMQFTWIIFLVLIFMVGRYYAVPVDTITPLNPVRKYVAFIALLIFILTFTPTPLYERAAEDTMTNTNTLFQISTMLVITCLTLPRWLRLRRLSTNKQM
ncbi:MAG: site-2 protease family protein [Chloroflexota bacterium]